jgi:ribosome-binding factor A
LSRRSHSGAAAGPSQRQLRAGELVRHALVEILALGELRDPDLQNVSIIIGEVRASPDLKHMTAFVAALGAAADPGKIATALNRSSGFLRGRLGRLVDLRHTPQLHFQPDLSYDEADHITRVLARPEVARDLAAPAKPDGEFGDQ